MKVCYFGTYRQEYSRNRIMIAGLRRNGVEVVECQVDLWQGIDDRIQTATGGWHRPSFWLRLVKVYAQLVNKLRHAGDYDLLMVGYPGQLDVFLAWLISRFQRKPLVWDVFMSIYLISLERGLNQKSRRSINLLRILEHFACRLPDRLILDTSAYVAWFQQQYHVAPSRFCLVPTGADSDIFNPINATEQDLSAFTALYFGTYIPNHHVSTIIEAARLLSKQKRFRFTLIGAGPDRPACEEIARTYHLDNLNFIDWMSETELAYQIASADVCLGAFGTTPQSMMTIQNKVYTGLAMARPVLTGDSPAIRQAFTDGVHLLLCPRKDPAALAAALEKLAANPELCRQMGMNGYLLFKEKYDIEHIGLTFKNHLDDVLRSKNQRV